MSAIARLVQQLGHTVFAFVRTATSDAGRFTKQLFSDWSGTTSAWATGFFVDGAISGFEALIS